MTVGLSDMGRPLADVARSFPQWATDPVPIVAETLDASARELHNRAYVLWAWTGTDAEGTPVLALSVPADAAREFRPRGPAQALARSIDAAVDAGAGSGLRVAEWLGHCALIDAGMDPELLAVALEEAHEPPARVSVARLPAKLVMSAVPMDLAPPTHPADLPLARLAQRAGVHPIEAALALAEHGASSDAADAYAPEVLARLARVPVAAAGIDPDTELEAPSDEYAGIDRDPYPRRRQARRLLRRMFGMKKIGAMHHTQIDHLYRGVPPDERRDALEVGEALIRAGLLGEKPSNGQRHVFLRRDALPAIHALMERGEVAGELAGALGVDLGPDEVTETRR